jgi:hypothetical protein
MSTIDNRPSPSVGIPPSSAADRKKSNQTSGDDLATGTTTIVINHIQAKRPIMVDFQRERNHNVAATAILWFKSQTTKKLTPKGTR